MRLSTIFKSIFIGWLITALIAGFLKFMHISGGQMLINLTVILAILCIVIALYEIYTSDRLTVSEKVMWTFGFIMFNAITLLLYFFLARKRILREFKVLNL